MQVEDITIFMRKEGIEKILKKQESTILNLATKIRTSKHRDEKHLCLHNFVTYTAQQIKYLRLLLDYPSEFLAWIARNLFEVYLLLIYVLKSPEYLKNFTSELATDEVEILEGIKVITPDDQAEILKNINERLQQILDTLKKHDMALIRHKHIADLVNNTDMSQEYKAFFKLYSKYVHPSAWLIHGSDKRIHLPEIRNTFLVQAQRYAGMIVKKVSDETGIDV